ncbi:Transcriptional regulator, MarR family [Methanosarcina siciliae T4/M]|uniref:HTH-type transcriptional regulator SarZ n=1 Tax=Methanosarcina siciliae T4/M TaxID=1434120 RepID=A0A0E3P225_9EURY|nr:MarR family transcriptional regulator [Methanosarcina siciliae]AKB27362.1 Transcriptional regulator, MarR family [Methanosarcina siciliae T4/M]
MPDIVEDEILRRVWKLGNALVKYRNESLKDQDLTSVQAEVISFILKNEDKAEINLLDVQKHLALTHPTVIGIAKRLEEKSFIKREQSKTDARYTSLKLTKKGLEFRNVLSKKAAENEEILLQGMKDDERKEFNRLLGIALKNMTEKRE